MRLLLYVLEAFRQRRIDSLAQNDTRKSLLVIVFILLKEDVIFRCFGTVDHLRKLPYGDTLQTESFRSGFFFNVCIIRLSKRMCKSKPLLLAQT